MVPPVFLGEPGPTTAPLSSLKLASAKLLTGPLGLKVNF
jgi:hypothetical protein